MSVVSFGFFQLFAVIFSLSLVISVCVHFVSIIVFVYLFSGVFQRFVDSVCAFLLIFQLIFLAMYCCDVSYYNLCLLTELRLLNKKY